MNYVKWYKLPVVNLSSLLIVCFSGYFMTNIMPISPVYFTTFLALLLLLLSKNFFLPSDRFIIYSVHFLYALYFPLNALINNTNIKNSIVMFFFGLYYIFCDIILVQVKRKQVMKYILKMYVLFFSIYYLIDFYLRYRNSKTLDIPGWIEVNPIYKFYLYKLGGLFADSNSLGVVSTCLFSIFFFAMVKNIVKTRIVVLIFIFCFFTFSRSAIIATLFLILFYNFFYKKKVIARFIFLLLSLVLLFLIFNYLMTDGSFISKIDIFVRTVEWLENCSVFEFIFGGGANTSIKNIGFYAHNIWSLLIVEYGMIGCILFILMMVCTCIDCGKNYFFVLLPYLIVSLSFTPIFLPFLMVSFVVIRIYDRLKG